jgi:hypothetical protein
VPYLYYEGDATLIRGEVSLDVECSLLRLSPVSPIGGPGDWYGSFAAPARSDLPHGILGDCVVMLADGRTGHAVIRSIAITPDRVEGTLVGEGDWPE